MTLEARESLTVAVFSIAVSARLSGRFDGDDGTVSLVDLKGEISMSFAAVRR